MSGLTEKDIEDLASAVATEFSQNRGPMQFRTRDLHDEHGRIQYGIELKPIGLPWGWLMNETGIQLFATTDERDRNIQDLIIKQREVSP